MKGELGTFHFSWIVSFVHSGTEEIVYLFVANSSPDSVNSVQTYFWIVQGL